MLDLFTTKKNKSLNLHISKKSSKHFPSPLREWKNSIYVYNKNSLNLIPSTTISINNFIKSYFNSFNKSIEIKMRTKRLLLRLRRLSSNKYYISNGGFKHTNNKVLINLYVFNRQKKNYLLILKNWYIKSFLKSKLNDREEIRNINKRNGKKDWNNWKKDWSRKTINWSNKQNWNKFSTRITKRNWKTRTTQQKIIKRINVIFRKSIEALTISKKNNYQLIKFLDWIKKHNKETSFRRITSLKNYMESFHKKLIKKSLRKIKMYFFYKQLLFINRSKLNYTYLQYLKKHLENLYKKNVEFNIINIKRFYLNSDILSESITNKLARNRRNMRIYLKKLRNKVEIKDKKEIFKQENWSKQDLNLDQDLTGNSVLLQKYIMNNLKYKHVTGYRLEAKGRLNKRFTASRSVSKLSYKGNLLDLYSSFKAVSSVVLKGNLKSNRQYTQLRSKSRIGSFGIKGWVGGN